MVNGWEITELHHRDGEVYWQATLYTEPLWRHIAGNCLYWVDRRKPRWLEPGNGRPSSRDNSDGTCTFLWRLNLELWLGYEFQHKRRKVIETVRVADRDPETWWKTDAPAPLPDQGSVQP